MKDLVSQQARSYNISNGGVQFSVISYSDTATTDLAINRGTNLNAVKKALDQIKPSDRERHIERALRTVREKIIYKRDGIRDYVNKVLVLLLVGKNTPSALQELMREAKSLNTAGIDLAIVGIGPNVNEDEVKVVAANPEDVVLVKSADNILSASAPLSKSVAASVRASPTVDLGFVIGATKSSENFDIGKYIIKSIVRRLEVASDKARIGLVVYGPDSRIILQLNTATDRTSVIRAVDNLKYPGQGNSLRRALESMKTVLHGRISQDRKGIPKTAIVFLDAGVDRSTRVAAEELARRGVNVIGIAVGDKTNLESAKDVSSKGVNAIRITGKKDVIETAENAFQRLRSGEVTFLLYRDTVESDVCIYVYFCHNIK